MNELQKLKVYQLAIEEYMFEFDELDTNKEEKFLDVFFNGDKDEINDLLKWRKEDKEYFIKEFTRLLNLVKHSNPKD